MKFHNISIFFLIFGVVSSIPATMSAQANKTDGSHKEKLLKKAATSTDSIKLLLDVYSISDKMNRDKIRLQIINLAERSDNNEVIGDVLKALSETTDDTRDLSRLIEISESLPEGEGKSTVQTVLHMEQAQAEAPGVSDQQVKDQIVENTRLALSLNSDPYKEIQNLYRAMVYLGTASQGPLYLEYVNRMDELVNALPEKDHAIKNLFYTTAALFYTRKRDYQKALEYDRKLVRELDAIKKSQRELNDSVHNLDYFYYVSYRRMLRNFMGLTPQEIEDLYQKCLDLAQQNNEVREAFGNGGLTKSYYYVATNQFAKAVPELHKALADSTISNFRRQELLGLLAWSLNNTGDQKNELLALREYTNMMMADLEMRREATYREIELRNSVNKLINDEYLAQEKQREENRDMRKTSVTLLYVLALILIFVCQAYFRLRSKVKLLQARNTKLRTNIEHIFDDGRPKGTHDIRHSRDRLKG